MLFGVKCVVSNWLVVGVCLTCVENTKRRPVARANTNTTKCRFGGANGKRVHVIE